MSLFCLFYHICDSHFCVIDCFRTAGDWGIWKNKCTKKGSCHEGWKLHFDREVQWLIGFESVFTTFTNMELPITPNWVSPSIHIFDTSKKLEKKNLSSSNAVYDHFKSQSFKSSSWHTTWQPPLICGMRWKCIHVNAEGKTEMHFGKCKFEGGGGEIIHIGITHTFLSMNT